MDPADARAARAANRRATWRGGKVKAKDAHEADVEFWAAAPGDVRLQAVWELALEAYADPNETAPRLRGSAGGIRKR